MSGKSFSNEICFVKRLNPTAINTLSSKDAFKSAIVTFCGNSAELKRLDDVNKVTFACISGISLKALINSGDDNSSNVTLSISSTNSMAFILMF